MTMLMKCQVPISHGSDLISASLKCCQIRRWQCSWLLKRKGENVVAASFSLGIVIKTKRELKKICPWKKIAVDETVKEQISWTCSLHLTVHSRVGYN